jgi:hypothetical protein
MPGHEAGGAPRSRDAAVPSPGGLVPQSISQDWPRVVAEPKTLLETEHSPVG